MSSNRKPHGDSGINVFSTGAESWQDVVTGREREGEGNVGWGGGSVFNVTFKEITRIYLRLKPPSK